MSSEMLIICSNVDLIASDVNCNVNKHYSDAHWKWIKCYVSWNVEQLKYEMWII